MKASFKRILALVMTALLCLGFIGCGRIEHNAKIIENEGLVYRTEWLENNYTYGAWIESGGRGYDEVSPKTRTYVIQSQAQLDEIFTEFPTTDFEKKMVLIHCYTTIYARKRVLKQVVIKDGILVVDFNVVNGKLGHADAAAPHRRVVVIVLDRVDVTDVKITYQGQ
jgi:hypothetical protein